MVFTTKSFAFGIALLLLLASISAQAVGLNTRDQNPMFQAYYLPTNSPPTQEGWNFSHSVFITNAFHTETKGNESLVIDAENYRYDLSLAYQQSNWAFGARFSLITTQAGSLDGLIEDWHDFFGFSQSGRNTNPNDQLNINYTRNGSVIYQQTSRSGGLGDIALTLAYSLASNDKGTTQLSFVLDLPTGSELDNTGNEAIDFAVWYRKTRTVTDRSSLFGLFGMSYLGKGGQLANFLERQVWVAQVGFDHRFNDYVSAILQLDMHSALVKDSALTALGNSLQMQVGLTFSRLIEDHDLSLFFSEDILIDSAPDITFSLQINRRF